MIVKYLMLFFLGFCHSLKNVKALVGLSIFLITCLLIFANLWKIAAARIGSIGLHPDELLWYIALNEWITVSIPDVHEEMEEDLRTGKLAYLLPRPISYLAGVFCEGLGALSANLLILGAVTFTFTWWKVGSIPFSCGESLIALLLGFLASVLGLLFLVLIGLSAFWIGQVAPFQSVWEKLLLTLGGIMLPLTVYPEWLQRIAYWTPFPLILGDRSLLAIQFDKGNFVSLLLRFAGWFILVSMVIVCLYRQGLKKVNAEGG